MADVKIENHVIRNFAYHPTESHQDQVTELFPMAHAKNHGKQQLMNYEHCLKDGTVTTT